MGPLPDLDPTAPNVLVNVGSAPIACGLIKAGPATRPTPAPTPTPPPTPKPFPPSFPCPMQGEHYIGIVVDCGAACAAGTEQMSITYTPSEAGRSASLRGGLGLSELSHTPSMVTSACFYAPEGNAATMNVTILPIPSSSAVDEAAIAKMVMPAVECATTKLPGGIVTTDLPRGYSCTLTNIPWCSAIIDLDFMFVFSAGTSVTPYTLKMPCQAANGVVEFK
jgi:hypothetical protein